MPIEENEIINNPAAGETPVADTTTTEMTVTSSNDVMQVSPSMTDNLLIIVIGLLLVIVALKGKNAL